MASDLLIPDWLTYRKGGNERSKVFFLDIRDLGLDLYNRNIQDTINKILHELLAQATQGKTLSEPGLIKCHIGEPKCITRMLPQYALSSIKFLKDGGVDNVVGGDTTTLYSGPRGYNENSSNDFSPYRSLAEAHGWHRDPSAAGIPFVILDRPNSSIPTIFEFAYEEVRKKGAGVFRNIHLSGGFAAAGTIINHVHLTGHTLIDIALCIKGLTMGLASRKGKLQMHQHLHPEINPQTCTKCGKCAQKCPEKALSWKKKQIPRVNTSKCIGCGECASICATISESIVMRGLDVTDWSKGKETFLFRLVDFLVGQLNGKWDDVINVAHLYQITSLCDCVNDPQSPMAPDIGFLVGRNPFAVDWLANQLLQSSMKCTHYANPRDQSLYDYAQNTYGIVVKPQVELIKMPLNVLKRSRAVRTPR